MKTKLPSNYLWQQLRRDLVGKDAYRGVTFSYSWLANQFGHFNLAFLPSIVIGSWLAQCYPSANYWTPVAVGFLWMSFETWNLLKPILNKKINYTFRIPWPNLVFDVVTDILFFWLGAAAAALFLLPNPVTGIVFGVIALALAYPARFWYKTKVFLQLATYPFQLRISQWQHPISAAGKAAVTKFLDAPTGGHHLLVYGGGRCGKTGLAVSIATEKSIARQAGVYLTGAKLYPVLCLGEADTATLSDCPWTWRQAQWMVVDDVNPGEPVEELMQPDHLGRLMQSGEPASGLNKVVLQQCNVVWVLGRTSPDPDLWAALLENLGVEKSNISTVRLGVTA